MSTTYVATPNFSTSVTIPSDGDLADVASVNPSTQSLADMDYYLLQSYGAMPDPTSPITIICQDPTSLTPISVYPVPFVVVTENGVQKVISTSIISSLSASNLEGGGSFVANKFYYIYIYSNAGLAAFQISTTYPDKAKLFKLNTNTHKYLGAFATNGAAAIIPFVKTRGVTCLYNQTTNDGGNSTTEAALNSVDQNVPPSSNIVMLRYRAENGGLTDGVFNIISISGTAGFEFVSPVGTTQGYLQLPAGYNYPSQTNHMFYKTSSINVNLTINVMGYIE